MILTNECKCIVDEELLAKAIDTYCRRKNVYCHDNYRITLHNNYPTVVISRKHLYVHDLLRGQLFKTRQGFVVHHMDFNKLNNSVNNLAYITQSKHTQIHSIHNWKEVKAKGIKYKQKQKREDIPDVEIRKMLDDGVPVKTIAELYKCHVNTIYRRIKRGEV